MIILVMKHMFAIFRNRDNFIMNPLKHVELDEIINCLTITIYYIVFMPNCQRIIEY